MILIQYAQEKYDEVWKRTDTGEIEQALKDLGKVVTEDCKLIEEAFQKYGKLEFGPNLEYKLTKNPKRKDIDKLRDQLTKDLKKWKDEKVLVVYVFACHGI